MSDSQQNLQKNLKENIRYLGKILCETILEKDGKATFDLIEGIRKAAVKFHRENDQEATLLLEKFFKGALVSPVLTAHYGKVLQAPYELPCFLRMARWLGGDRDGNPFVNGATLAQATTML